MALPIINLPTRTRSSNTDGLGSFHESVVGTRQAKPYDKPATYEVNRVSTTYAKLFGDTTTHGGMADASSYKGDYLVDPTCSMPCVSEEIDWAVNSAREALINELNEEAMIAVNIAERQQSINMMTNRVMQIYRFTSRLRRGDIRGAAAQLRVDPTPIRSRPKGNGRWRRSKDYSNAWLEFHFGWEPLVKDIGACIDLLSEPIPGGVFTVKGRNTPFDKWSYRLINSSYNEYQRREIKGRVRGKAGAEIYVTDPNAYLANRLGLVNPLSVVWELVPYSFVVDWFANVGQFIGQFSDLYGCTVLNPWYGWTMVVGSSRYEYHYDWGNQTHGQEVTQTALYSRRYLGIPSVKLGIRPPKRLSVVRAATAIALLVQKL
ncbi:maturation protein [ssRNA phage ESE029]|uniref:Maturation protein n=1 Tax=ssRNA phage ESE029 TaxID=2786005 RepID=A0A8S5KXY8_9VIRU|nr:maturation protein [ssRNA phage ESE029]DAD49909.1 TPA_asm: maturation protein [ssRNA phage ESE029]